MLSDNAPLEGEESLYDDIRNTAEVMSGGHPVGELLEAALYGTNTFDEMMDQWNEKWTSAQESFGVEVNE
ncbi:MAG: hypothetical protein HFG41_13675 [Coprococcus sp.]|nr:hypothetical protein [Coprococcus sp.]